MFVKNGDNLKGGYALGKNKMELETKKKISDSLKGRMPKNIKLLHKKAKKFKKGHIPWNKGIPFKQTVTEEIRIIRKVKISNTLKENYRNGKNKPYWKNKKYPIKARLKISESNRKENHWNWQGGITKKRDMSSLKIRQWRNDIFKRDNYTCKICGKSSLKLNQDLNAHHIKEWAKYPNLRYKRNNGITLCVPCHREIHRKC